MSEDPIEDGAFLGAVFQLDEIPVELIKALTALDQKLTDDFVVEVTHGLCPIKMKALCRLISVALMKHTACY